MCTEPKTPIFSKTQSKVEETTTSKIWVTKCEKDKIEYQHCGKDDRPTGPVMKIKDGCLDFGGKVSLGIEVSKSKSGSLVVILLVIGICCCCIICCAASNKVKEDKEKENEKEGKEEDVEHS